MGTAEGNTQSGKSKVSQALHRSGVSRHSPDLTVYNNSRSLGALNVQITKILIYDSF